MINTERQGYVELFKLSSANVLSALLYTTGVLFIEESLGDHLYKNAGQIGSVLGVAVAFFLGFRMNSAYDRWWEARKILGELNNTTRSFCCKVRTYLGQAETTLTEKLLVATEAYLHALRDELLGLPAEIPAVAILEKMSLLIEAAVPATSPWEKSDLMQHINRFFDIQGKAERIKNTPFLKIYSAFTRIIVLSCVLLMPLFLGDIDIGGEASRLEYLALPITALISSIFLTINKLANLCAEPFSGNPTALPVPALFAAMASSSGLTQMPSRDPAGPDFGVPPVD